MVSVRRNFSEDEEVGDMGLLLVVVVEDWSIAESIVDVCHLVTLAPLYCRSKYGVSKCGVQRRD